MTEPVPAPAPQARPGRREEVVVLGLLALGSGLLLVAAGQAWGTAVVTEVGVPALAVTATGRDVAVEAAAAGVVGLAGIAGLLATGRVGRLLVGLVLGIAGVAAGAVSWGFPGRAEAGLDALLADRAGAELAASVTTTSWWLVSAAGAVVVVGCGGIAAVRGGRWPRMGARYERAPKAVSRPGHDDAWAALDRGEDPTA